LSRIKIILLSVAAFVACVVLAIVAFVLWSIFHGRAVPPAQPGTAKVACVGDSITYGVFNDGYPGELQKLMGDAWSVRNFGAISHTVQKDGDHSYWGHRYFRLSTEFEPDLVLIMLGSNDSKDQNWRSADAFTRDYRALIVHYQSLPSKPRIVLMTPPSTFLVKGRSELPGHINAAVIEQIAGIVKNLGAALSLQVIDIHAATADHPELFPNDGIHPNAAGNTFIANRVYEALKARGGDQQP
jgi:lysophospholipase L1-like esterase